METEKPSDDVLALRAEYERLASDGKRRVYLKDAAEFERLQAAGKLDRAATYVLGEPVIEGARPPVRRRRRAFRP